MATVVLEAYDSQTAETGDAAHIEFTFHVMGTANRAVAIAALEAETASTLGGLVRSRIRVEPVHIDEDDADECVWAGLVEYDRPERTPEIPETGDDITSFEIGGGSLHIYQAVKHIQHYEPGGVAGTGPDYKGALNVVHRDGKPDVQGVEIPQLDGAQIINLTRYLTNAEFSPTYRRIASRLANHVNDAAFTIVGVDEFEAGEVLFVGMSGRRRGKDGDWEVGYRFAVRPNIADACADWPAGAKPTVAVPKKGWEYLWVAYGEEVDADQLVPKAISINVDQVHRTATLADLNPGE